MTSEIAVLNKEAIALAADSASTVEHAAGRKIFTSANKIFALSNHWPVGVMIFGNAQLMGVPLETIIKVYRDHLGKQDFKTLKEHADDFFAFLNSNDARLFPSAQQERFVAAVVHGHFETIKRQIKSTLDKAIQDQNEVTDDDVRSMVEKFVGEHHQTWQEAPFGDGLREDHVAEVKEKYKEIIDRVRGEVFENLPQSEGIVTKLQEIATLACAKFPARINEGGSGIVIAGFGHDDIFPQILSYMAVGIANGKLKYRSEPRLSYSALHENRAALIPFAQTEMVMTFMEGVDPAYSAVIDSAMAGIVKSYGDVILNAIEELPVEKREDLSKRLSAAGVEELKKQRERLKAYRRDQFSRPVVNIIGMLPKDELAVMAESLVTLTSLKLRVTPEEETVAGAVDVAVISKGDGFIWIKRKHYFKPELNPRFLANLQRGGD
jgi:hypothetical protein